MEDASEKIPWNQYFHKNNQPEVKQIYYELGLLGNEMSLEQESSVAVSVFEFYFIN